MAAVKIRHFIRSDLIFPYRPCNLDIPVLSSFLRQSPSPIPLPILVLFFLSLAVLSSSFSFSFSPLPLVSTPLGRHQGGHLPPVERASAVWWRVSSVGSSFFFFSFFFFFNPNLRLSWSRWSAG